jgi:hypothetical protein
LDEASVSLKKLPANPTVEQLNQWSMEWGASLVNHYREGGETPPSNGSVSEVLLMTRVGNEFYLNRAGVEWDGFRFVRTTKEGELDKAHPQVEYSGLCRQFTNHTDREGNRIPARDRTPGEERRLNRYGERKNEAKTVDDLMYAATGLEAVLTDIDARLEPEHPVIAPPYATAEWADGDSGWTTQFNAECESNAAKPCYELENQSLYE